MVSLSSSGSSGSSSSMSLSRHRSPDISSLISAASLSTSSSSRSSSARLDVFRSAYASSNSFGQIASFTAAEEGGNIILPTFNQRLSGSDSSSVDSITSSGQYSIQSVTSGFTSNAGSLGSSLGRLLALVSCKDTEEIKTHSRASSFDTLESFDRSSANDEFAAGIDLTESVDSSSANDEFALCVRHAWPPPRALTKDDFSLYDPPLDGNCLFNALEFLKSGRKIDNLGFNGGATSLRSQLMDHLERNQDEIGNDGVTLGAEAIQCDDVLRQYRHVGKSDQLSTLSPEHLTVSDYATIMRDGTPFRCCWGGGLELRIFSKLFSVNVAVYQGEVDDLEFNLLSSYEFNEQSASIYLLYTNGDTHYNAIVAQQGSEVIIESEADQGA